MLKKYRFKLDEQIIRKFHSKSTNQLMKKNPKKNVSIRFFRLSNFEKNYLAII